MLLKSQVNGRLILEGALRIHWGVRGVIHLKEDDDQRTVVTARNRNSCRRSMSEVQRAVDLNLNRFFNPYIHFLSQDGDDDQIDASSKDISPPETETESEPNSVPVSPDHPKSVTLPMKLDVKNMEWDELDELLQVERKVDEGNKLYQTMPVGLPSISSQSGTVSQASLEDPGAETLESNPQLQAAKHSLDNDSSINSTPTHSMDSSSSTDTPNYQGTPNRNGTLRRVEYYDSLEKNIGVSNRTLSNDDSWIEKGLNRSMSGPDCLQRHRTDSDTDSVNSLHFRDDDNMTMSTDSGLEVRSDNHSH